MGNGGEEKEGEMYMKSLREEGRRKGGQREQPLDTHPDSQGKNKEPFLHHLCPLCAGLSVLKFYFWW